MLIFTDKLILIQRNWTSYTKQWIPTMNERTAEITELTLHINNLTVTLTSEGPAVNDSTFANSIQSIKNLSSEIEGRITNIKDDMYVLTSISPAHFEIQFFMISDTVEKLVTVNISTYATAAFINSTTATNLGSTGNSSSVINIYMTAMKNLSSSVKNLKLATHRAYTLMKEFTNRTDCYIEARHHANNKVTGMVLPVGSLFVVVMVTLTIMTAGRLKYNWGEPQSVMMSLFRLQLALLVLAAVPFYIYYLS